MARLDLTFFGAFQATLDDEPITHFRSANIQGLLVYLALHADRPLAREVLITLFWPDDPEKKARANFRQSLYLLRKLLKDDKNKAAGDEPPRFLITRQTVQFNPNSDYSLDVERFRAAVAQSNWDDALIHAEGEFLSGFACESAEFEEWLLLEREHWQQQVQAVMSNLAEAQIQQGNFAEAQSTARRLLELEPWREAAHRHLMQALALAGDRSGALAQFERCYEILETELGIEPDPATTALYEQIATDVITVTTTEQALPQPPTTFVGRMAEISHILRTLRKPDCRVLTLVGPGGVGKTRLAVQVAHTFVAQSDVAQSERAVRFVSLLGITEVVQAQKVLAQTLGIALLDPARAVQQITNKLKETTGLLVLDNAEPLLANDGAASVDLLNQISVDLPELRILVTARQPVQAQQEWTLPIQGLAYPTAQPPAVSSLAIAQNYDAVTLFTQRAQQARVTFALTERNLPHVLQLCRQLSGHPLAIELAAAQMRDKSVAQLLSELEDDPQALAVELQDLPPRHRSLSNVYQQSWELLTETEQVALRYAAIFDGGFTRAAAAAVMGEFAQHIDSLIAKSLLTCRQTTNELTRVRYEMTDALRAFLNNPLVDKKVSPSTGEQGRGQTVSSLDTSVIWSESEKSSFPADLDPSVSESLGDHSMNEMTPVDLMGLTDRRLHATFYLQWAVDHQAHLATEWKNLLAAWKWAQNDPSVEVPPHWNPQWLDDLPQSSASDELRDAVTTPARPALSLPVGRDTEMAQLRSLVPILLQQRTNGGIVTIIGSAGLGKSHLVAQLRQETPELAWFDCPCDESSAQSLLPFHRWLTNYFAQNPQDAASENWSRFNARFDDLVQATADTELAAELTRLSSMLAALVDLREAGSLYARLQPEQRRDNFEQAIKALIKAESLLQPLILHVEDAHWIDSDSHTLLGNLLRNVDAYPFAILVTARPERFELLPATELPQQIIRLESFNRDDVFQMAQQRLAHNASRTANRRLSSEAYRNPDRRLSSEAYQSHDQSEPDDALIDLLLTKGKGNPFYTEQLLHYLIDYGLVADGKLVQSGDLAAGGTTIDTLIPVDTQNVLTARLNHLDADVRKVVDQAAVLGQEFSLPVLQALVGVETDVGQSLNSATDAAIVQPLSGDRYVFNHALLREAAYDAQLDDSRRQLHAKAAQAVTAVATSTQPQFATVARHYDEAQNATRAVRNYLRAGDEAQENYFLREAYAHYTRGLELAEYDDERLPLYLGREAVNHWLGNRDEQKEDLRQLVGLAAGSDDLELLVDITLRRATFALATSDYDEAVKHAQQAARNASAMHNKRGEAQAYHLWGRALWQQGKAKQAEPLLRRSLLLSQGEKDVSHQALSHYDLAMLAYSTNRLDEARSELALAAKQFEQNYDKQNLIRCINMLGVIDVVDGAFERAIEYYEESLKLCGTIDWLYGKGYILARLGDYYFHLGDYEKCREMHQAALDIARQLRDQGAEAISLDTIGLSYQAEGNTFLAKEKFELALELHNHINYPRGKAFVETHLGALLTDLEELEPAAIYLFSALTARNESNMTIAIDTEAALAWLDMARGDVSIASIQASFIVDKLAENGIDGVELPLKVYWQCYTIFKMNGQMEEAKAALKDAHTLLHTRVNRVKSDTLRQQLLTQVPYHRQIEEAWNKEHPNH